MLDQQGLQKFNFFSDLTIDTLDEILGFCELRTLKKGDLLFSQNDKAENLYGIIDGSIELSIVFQEQSLKTEVNYEESVYKSLETKDRPIVVGEISSGEIIGWSSFTRSLKMSASAKCISDTKVFSIPTEKIFNLFKKDPALGYALMVKMCDVISNRLKIRTDLLVEAWGEAFNTDSIG